MPVKKKVATKDLYIKSIPTALFDLWKAKCYMTGETMRSALIKYMRKMIQEK